MKILTVAELTANKGLVYAITAMCDVPDATLDIMGDGELRKEFVSGDRVKMLGEVPNAAERMHEYDIFLLPSLKEGLPYTILEAGLAGLPVVATNVGGIPDLIEDYVTGLLVPPKDPHAIALALQKLILDPALRSLLGSALRAKVARDFTKENMIAKTLAVYQQ